MTIIASSVDAERAFSQGRLQVNHLQHNMSSQTFKANMAIGSWSKTPLLPGLVDITKIIETRMQRKQATVDSGSDSESDKDCD